MSYSMQSAVNRLVQAVSQTEADLRVGRILRMQALGLDLESIATVEQVTPTRVRQVLAGEERRRG